MTHSAAINQAIESLHDMGAFFVLCRGGDGPQRKAPITANWPKIRPPVSRVLAHYPDRPLGIVPWSVRTTTLDKDFGDASQLIAEFPPLAELLSQRAGRDALVLSRF